MVFSRLEALLSLGLKLPRLVRLLMIKTDFYSLAAFVGSLRYPDELFLLQLPLPMWIHLCFSWPFVTPPSAHVYPVTAF